MDRLLASLQRPLQSPGEVVAPLGGVLAHRLVLLQDFRRLGDGLDGPLLVQVDDLLELWVGLHLILIHHPQRLGCVLALFGCFLGNQFHAHLIVIGHHPFKPKPYGCSKG